MGVVLRETADAQEAVENATTLVAVDGAEFSEADGQIAPFDGRPAPQRRGLPVSGLDVAAQAVRRLLVARTGVSA